MYGIYNNRRKEFQFGICEPSKRKAEKRLFEKIGKDGRRKIMLKVPNLELLEYKAKEYFFSQEENKALYEKKSVNNYCQNFFRVEMFPQMWSSTCLGFDVNKNGKACIGGDAMTEAYTVVFYEPITEIYLVFFNDRICYQVREANETFFNDLKNHQLEPLSRALKLY